MWCIDLTNRKDLGGNDRRCHLRFTRNTLTVVGAKEEAMVKAMANVLMSAEATADPQKTQTPGAREAY